MKKSFPTILIIFVSVFVLVALAFAYSFARQIKINSIDDFEACLEAGYPVAESYPRQCHTPDGRGFTEVLPGGQTLCPMDAKICPNGSYVGRVVPDCEFSPCP